MSNKESTVAERARYHFFYNGPFCQWHPSPFKTRGMTFGCAEQWMMWHKARLFDDQASARAILMTDDPREQKALGRTVRGYTDAAWHAVARSVVLEGSLLKFRQNRRLEEALARTAGRLLVEASPTDVVWGIGLAEDDPRRHDYSQWRGTNWLGEVLTETRAILCGV